MPRQGHEEVLAPGEPPEVEPERPRADAPADEATVDGDLPRAIPFRLEDRPFHRLGEL